MEAKLYKANGKIIACNPDLKTKKFTLKELQSFVGGFIECFKLPSGRLITCNEDGKHLGLPVNFAVTDMAIAQGLLQSGDYFVGDILVCDAEMVQ